MALELERELDLAFAANAVLEYGLADKDDRSVKIALESLLDERMDTFGKIPFPYPKQQFRELAPALNEHGFAQQTQAVLARIDASEKSAS
jgi:hypothetical protein